MTGLYVLAFAVIYAMGWTNGNLRGQIKASREHLKFLREASKRADEEHAMLSALLVERATATPQPGGGGEG